MAYSWVVYFNPERNQQYQSIPLHFEGNVYGDLLLTNFLANGSNPLITREAVSSVGEFDSSFPHCADWDYYLRLANQWSFVVVPKHQVFYSASKSVWQWTMAAPNPSPSPSTLRLRSGQA